jgi:hypothetical protein|tara:strand:+ start:139 stop:474 length:336 start_codon:yes stop_codon:yes gene_type:complete
MAKPRAPIKFQVIIMNDNDVGLHGTAMFHEKEYKLTIMPEKNTETMKIPFNVLGIMNENHLVRFSGKSGAYTEFKPEIKNSTKDIEIESTEILNDLEKQETKYDTIEIFVN